MDSHDSFNFVELASICGSLQLFENAVLDILTFDILIDAAF